MITNPRSLLRFCIAFLFCALSVQMAYAALEPSEDFGAYYTKLDTGADFERIYRAGKFVDIIVELGEDNGKLVFWCGTSFLPYWETPEGKWSLDELVPRKGDGPKERPDDVNSFSVVKIIESSEEQVVVHWRYLPVFGAGNPKTGVSATKFVDEYFYVKPDGSVLRTVKKGTEKVLDWVDEDNFSSYRFNLKKNGISKASVKIGKPSGSDKKVSGSVVVSKVAAKPVAWWTFDEGQGEQASESLSGKSQTITGNKSLWRKGVSGTSLQFDGYNTKIEVPASQAPKISSAITLEGWVALGAYPWNWTPIVQQMKDVPEEIDTTQGQSGALTGEDGREAYEESVESSPFNDYFVKYKYEDDYGYFLGINGDGNPGLKLRVDGKWQELTGKKVLERRQWYHLAGTYDKKTGTMSVYVDGELVGQKTIAKGNIELSSKPLKIGQGKERRQINPVRANTFPGQFSVDGLLDEVRIYDVALTANQVASNFKAYDKNTPIEMDQRVLPKGRNSGEFGAYYTHLSYYDVWDNLWRFGEHPDVVVEFDESPAKFVFWRGVSYIPMLVNDLAQWYSNEFNETWSTSGGAGCQEPMSDKQSYHNHAKIIENTPARTVVQWRFPLVDVQHIMANFDDNTGWSDWSEWTYYIYPDGVGCKYLQLFTHGFRNHEWQESMAIFGPDQHPEQIIEKKGAVTMINLEGESESYDWLKLPPNSVEEPAGACIQHINYTGEYDPVTISDPFLWNGVYGGELTSYSVFPTWNHWPVAQLPSDGRYANFPDRTSHSSLTHLFPQFYEDVETGPKPYYSKIFLEGMLKTTQAELIGLAKSWQYAPKISNNMVETIQSVGYDRAQRAYILKVMREVEEEGNDDDDEEDDEEDEEDEEGPGMAAGFRINASKSYPFVNGCFVIRSYNDKTPLAAFIDGKPVKTRQGDTRNTDGQWDKVIWVEAKMNKPFVLTFEPE